ncbi:MAG: MoxR family ATPase [Deltaproteobacteria bacterium]|nr:MoxR family ATPase [Deltaproteobacteria bacterium]
MAGHGLLGRLGVFGHDAIEDAVLAALALGDPLLLIGAQGSAKTWLAQQLAAAMGMRFWAYDASKAMFEDVIGFPDPRTLQDGRVEYLATPLTLWGKQFVLVDELSRATAGMQNKWLEVIRSRRVMGMPLPDLKIVIAAMNPPGMVGTSALDEALAGRFTFVLDVPELRQMSPEDRVAVIENRTADDAVALAPAPSTGAAGEGGPSGLADAVRRTRAGMPAAEKAVGAAATTYADRVASYLESREVFLDGRRAGMIRRAVVALVAANRALGRLPRRATARGVPLDLLRHALDVTLPFRAVGRPVSRMTVDGAHAHAAAAIEGRDRRPLPFVNLLSAVRAFLAEPAGDADPDAASLLVTRVAAAVEHPTRVEATVQAAAALAVLACRPDVLARVRPEARHRILSCWREMTSVAPERASEFAGHATAPEVDSRLPPPVLAGLLRIAFRLAGRLDRLPAVNCSFEEFAPKLVALVEGGVS